MPSVANGHLCNSRQWFPTFLHAPSYPFTLQFTYINFITFYQASFLQLLLLFILGTLYYKPCMADPATAMCTVGQILQNLSVVQYFIIFGLKNLWVACCSYCRQSRPCNNLILRQGVTQATLSKLQSIIFFKIQLHCKKYPISFNCSQGGVNFIEHK